MKILINLFRYSFFLALIIVAVIYRDVLFQFYNRIVSQSGTISQIADSISSIMAFF
ncbi:hypothetical protein Q4R86_08020 [Morganella morganii]|uniref:hypothetical protein n=1 Tax=Morganella morganii TaxID=582 RepID=UPI00091036BD|nr:hypothetical protein [Morganella morganii]SHL96174.1 hypothetical protein SAMN05216301_1444 [Morganella morganii]